MPSLLVYPPPSPDETSSGEACLLSIGCTLPPPLPHMHPRHAPLFGFTRTTSSCHMTLPVVMLMFMHPPPFSLIIA